MDDACDYCDTLTTTCWCALKRILSAGARFLVALTSAIESDYVQEALWWTIYTYSIHMLHGPIERVGIHTKWSTSRVALRAARDWQSLCDLCI